MLVALVWLIANLFATAVLAFYSMLEMACVSFNKVRLQYYLSKGVKQALWLNALLQNPALLFGTTLIGVNIAIVVGSECAREFYSALGLSPNLAPITQVILVVILGELAPMFAARHYSEHVVMLGIGPLYASSKLMAPLLWILSLISKMCHFIIGGDEDKENIFLTQEELLTILEEPSQVYGTDSYEYNKIAYNIFKLRHLNARSIMRPLSNFKSLPSNSTVQEMRDMLSHHKEMPFFPIYHRSLSQIIGIAFPRDLIRSANNRRVRDYSKTPWFITETTSAMQLLQQMRNNNQTVAFVIDHHGSAVGVITLDMLIDELIAFEEDLTVVDEEQPEKILLNLTVSAEMTVGEFLRQYKVSLGDNPQLSLGELMQAEVDHPLEKGDSVLINSYQLTVKEASLTAIKEISVSSPLG